MSAIQQVVIRSWNHTNTCYSGYEEECDCGLDDLLELVASLENDAAGAPETARWTKRMMALETRIRKAQAVLRGA